MLGRLTESGPQPFRYKRQRCPIVRRQYSSLCAAAPHREPGPARLLDSHVARDRHDTPGTRARTVCQVVPPLIQPYPHILKQIGFCRPQKPPPRILWGLISMALPGLFRTIPFWPMRQISVQASQQNGLHLMLQAEEPRQCSVLTHMPPPYARRGCRLHH